MRASPICVDEIEGGEDAAEERRGTGGRKRVRRR